MRIFALRQCADYACASYVGAGRWGVRGTCYVCCRRSCLDLVFVISDGPTYMTPSLYANWHNIEEHSLY